MITLHRSSPPREALRTFTGPFQREFLKISCTLFALCGLTTFANAQILISNTIPVTENFTISTSGTAALPVNWKMTGQGAGSSPTWSAGTNVTACTQALSSGGSSSSPGGRYNWGNGTTTTDRAIGFMTSGSYASPNSVMAFYQNNTGSTITALALAFDIERYRINTAAANVTFFTSTDGSTWTAQTAGDTGAFTPGVSAYNYTSGTVVNKSFSLTGLSIGAGSSIYLRWNFDTTGSNSQGLGLDNVSVTATTSGLPAPAISSFTPSSGWIGTVVTLTGTNFTAASAVKFNGADAASYNVDSATQITCTAPVGVTTGKISVTTTNGTGVSLTDFTAANPDSVTLSASPTTFGENATNPASTGTVTRTVVTASPMEVFLSSSAPSHASVPTSVTIPANTASIPFSITAVPDNTITPNNTVTITATVNAFSIGTNVIVTNTDLAPLSVVINKISKTATNTGAGDRFELLVVGNQTPGSTVDMRGMILKDYSNNGVDDAGGAVQFNNIPFWSAIPVGTLVVIEDGNAISSDVVATDFLLSLGASDTAYFTQLTTSAINLALSDLLMIKAAGSGVAGNNGGIHAFALGTPTTFHTTFPGSKLNAVATGDNLAAIAVNGTSTLADYNVAGTAGATGAVATASVTFGVANNPENGVYISQLRGGLSDGYSLWINSYYNPVTDPNIIGFNKDPDNDGIPNAVEALIGGNPKVAGIFTTTELIKTGNVFTFLYPQARTVPSGVTAAYEWSSDLQNWYATAQSDGTNTVTLSDGGTPYNDDNVSPTVDYQVTATVTVGTPAKLFIRVCAE